MAVALDFQLMEKDDVISVLLHIDLLLIVSSEHTHPTGTTQQIHHHKTYFEQPIIHIIIFICIVPT